MCPNCETAIRVPQFNVRQGLRIGDFILKEKLGSGGMGEVWLAEQLSMQRDVALKILSPSLAGDNDFCVRFQHEARNSGRLLHPNIVTAFYAGIEDELHYLAMSYVEGIPLELEIEARGVIPEDQALRIVRDIAGALNYGWIKFGLIHRDIKPSNIMLCRDGSAKLLDLGISKSMLEGDSATTLTKSGVFVGTPYYVSPEQVRNVPDIDCRADIYSLGAVLYHMLSGMVPYEATTPMGVVAMHLSEPLPDIRRSRSELSSGVVALIRKMMAKNRDERHESWQEVMGELERLSSAPGGRAKWNGGIDFGFLRDSSRRMRLMLAAAGGAFVLMLVAALALSGSSGSSVNADKKADDPFQEVVNVDGLINPAVSVVKPGVSETKAGGGATDKAVAPSDPVDAGGGQETGAGIRQIPGFDFSFFRGHLQLSDRQEQDIRKVFRLGAIRAAQLAGKLKGGLISEGAYQDEIQSLRRETAGSLKHILNDEQLRKYKEWDRKELMKRWRHPGFDDND